MKMYGKLSASTALLSALVLSGPAFADQPAQSVTVNLTGAGDYAVTSEQDYRFNKTTAATYFTNTVTSGPVVSCNGNATNCGSGNQPTTPTTPAPDASKLNSGSSGNNDVTGSDRCQFLDGGSLTEGTYTQAVTINGKNGHGNWTFTWTYTIAPTVASVDPFTAWDLVSSSGGGTLEINFNANIGAQSVDVSNGYPHGKYSFTLGSTSDSRVKNLNLSVSDGTTTTSTPVGSIVVVDNPHGTVDFISTGNAGRYGTGIGALLDAGFSVPRNNSGATSGDARSILNGLLQSVDGKYYDTFAANNDGGAGGTQLAKAVMNTVTQNLGVGNYTVTLTGTVKNKSINLPDQSFSISETISIVTPGCGAGNQ